jgi:hypothetical protein
MLPGGECVNFPLMKTIKLSKDNNGGINMDEKINPKTDFRIGSIVKYFQYDSLSAEDVSRNVYLYQILAFATMIVGEDRRERLVIYQALYNHFETFAMPLDEFRSTINREKYPNTKQEFLYEIYEEVEPPYIDN